MAQVDLALEKVKDPNLKQFNLLMCGLPSYEMYGEPVQEQIKAFEKAKACLKYIVERFCETSA